MSIPEELLALPQWVAWRYETRQTPRGPKQTKVPYDPKHTDGLEKRASSTDPSTWGTYVSAVTASLVLTRRTRPALKRVGIGFVFSADDPYVGVDMDACFERRVLHRAANDILRLLGGYHEISPSDNGLHIIVRGSIERGRHTLKTEWGNELAIYDRGRFFTMRGDGSGAITSAQAGIDQLLTRYFTEAPRVSVPVRPQEPLCDTDREVLDRIHADYRIAALWAGDSSDHGDDRSAGDLALCAHLAYFTGNDFSRIDSLFRASGRMRDKWDQPRGDSTYGRLTIERAMKV